MSDIPRSLTIDVTLLDIVVRDDEGKPVRPWMVVALDGSTRQVVAAKSSCSQPDKALYQAFLEETRKQNGGTLYQLIVDTGLATSLKKTARELNMDIHILRSHPRVQGRIERLFQALNNQFLSQLPSHIHSQNAEKPADFPDLTLAELEQKLNEFIAQYNAAPENLADAPEAEIDPLTLEQDDEADNEDDLGWDRIPEIEPRPF